MRLWRILFVAGAVLSAAAPTAATAASLYQSVTVGANAEKVWKLIGPFCAIKDWHPAIGQCTEKDGVRTMTTKDGKGQFVEKETDRKPLSYSYVILSSPLPITDYRSTLKILPRDNGSTTVEWSGTYTPAPDKAEAAAAALDGIYKSGLDNLPKLLGK